MPRERIFLTGMMGCGKSTVGQRLSELVGVPYLDNDTLLAGREGVGLMGLAAQGSDRLHDAEAAAAASLARRPPPFVAGIAASVVERHDVVASLVAAGLVVYLRARPATLLTRVTSSERPWLEHDPLGFLTETLARRGPLFEAAAHLVVDTDSASPTELAATIAAALSTAPEAG